MSFRVGLIPSRSRPFESDSNPFESLRVTPWFYLWPWDPSEPGFQPLRGPSRVLRVPSWGESFCLFQWTILSTHLASLACPSRASSNPLVALRLNVLRDPSWISFELFLEILSPLGGPWRIPLEPPPTPSWPFAVLRGPSWISFCLFVEILSPFGDPWQTPLELPPTP